MTIYATIQKYSGYQVNLHFTGDIRDLQKIIKDSDLYEKILSTNKSDYDSPIRLR